jgi:outer membrane protein OmpA-like peptidoglycan-associated protein
MKTKLPIIEVLLLLFTIFSFSQTTPGEYTIDNLKSNSKNSDFGPTFFGDNKIIFSSSRGGGKKWDNDQPFLDLYEGVINQDGSVTKVKRLSSTINSKYHESSVSFSPDKKTVYFTRNNDYDDNYETSIEVDTTLVIKTVKRRRGDPYKKAKKEKQKMTYIAMYRADIDESGKWKNITPLPFNNRNYSVGHPAVNRDGTKLYFTSDMPGTYGGTDIFVVNILSDGEYSKPKNLGRKINTLGREMFPYIDTKNILYFSSDSRKGGLGELDIYAVKIYDNSISKALHLGAPINSKNDDFGIILNNDIDEGYFSSTRKGGKGDDDIYHFLASPPLNIECTQSVTGVIKNTKTSKPIANALVVLLNENGEEQNTYKTKSNGKYKFEAPCDTNFKIIASKDRYESDNGEFLTKNDPGTKLELNLNLKPIIVCLQVVNGMVRDTRTKKAISNATISIVDETGKKLNIANTNSKGVFTIKVLCDANYKLTASKDKYENDDEFLSAGKKSGDIVNIEMQLKLKPDLTEVKILKNKVIVNIDPIYFELNKANINKDAATELNKVVAIMKKYPKLIIEGGSHTDVRGTSGYNLDLSTRRANSTVSYIINHGIDASRITAKGYGESQPANHCLQGVRCSDEEHRQNRRTEFVILNPDVLGYY